MSEEEKKQEEVQEEKVEEVKEEPKAEAKPETEEVEVPAKFKTIVNEIDKLSVLDLHELVQLFEKKFGVSASAVAVAQPGQGGDGGDDSGGTVDVTLEAAGDQKIQVIKVVKEVLGLGLKEAKDFVDGAPKVIKEGASKEEADDLKAKIEEVGGKVSVK